MMRLLRRTGLLFGAFLFALLALLGLGNAPALAKPPALSRATITDVEQAVVVTTTLSGIPLSAAGITLTVAQKPAIVAAWQQSPHADLSSAAFSNWNDNASGMIPSGCARCHSTRGIAGDIEAMRGLLWNALQAYTQTHANVESIAYDRNRFPFYFNDAGAAYTTWTPELLRAAYNYDYAVQDPAAYVHNPTYVVQLLYDSIDDLGGSTAGLVRPVTR